MFPHINVFIIIYLYIDYCVSIINILTIALESIHMYEFIYDYNILYK